MTNEATDEQRALDALWRMKEWVSDAFNGNPYIMELLEQDYETIRNALIRDNSDALRVAKEALEAGVYALAYVEDNGKGDGITLAAEGLMREAITKLNAAMGG